jgi:predicted Rossmann fold nucleotide-binding protein DprA/Smf involved in DNA uptake
LFLVGAPPPPPGEVDLSSETTKRVFEFVVNFKAAHDGISPTVREIASELHIAISTTARALCKLERAGWIKTRYGLSRGIMVSGGVWRLEACEFRGRKLDFT